MCERCTKVCSMVMDAERENRDLTADEEDAVFGWLVTRDYMQNSEEDGSAGASGSAVRLHGVYVASRAMALGDDPVSQIMGKSTREMVYSHVKAMLRPAAEDRPPWPESCSLN